MLKFVICQLNWVNELIWLQICQTTGWGGTPIRAYGLGGDEGEDLLARGLCIGVDHGKLGEVDHVGDDVNDGEDDDRPGDSLVERNVLIEGNERVEGRLAKKRDEVTANREKDEGHIDMEDERSRTGNSFGLRKEVRRCCVGSRPHERYADSRKVMPNVARAVTELSLSW